MRNIYKTRTFARWLKKSMLDDKDLLQAVLEMEAGLIDARLGANLFKKRIACKGRGKRDSFRTIIATNLNDKWFFMLGFAKNDKDNISSEELEASKETAEILLNLSFSQLDILVEKAKLEKIYAS